MNLKEGKIGRQEALSIVAVAASCSGIFTTNSNALYANGNSAYVSMLASAGVALLVFLAVTYAMRVTGSKNLWNLLKRGLGSIFSRVIAVFYALMLVVMAANLFGSFTLMMGRFVFPQSPEWKMLLYLLLAAVVPAYLGLEGISRTTRLLVWVLLASLLGTLVLAFSNYEPSRLAPVLGDGALSLLEKSMRGLAQFLPALLALLIVTKGVHGIKNAKKTGVAAAAVSGILSAVAQLSLGMTYSYKDLAAMHSPFYRLTTSFKTGGYIPRLDILLTFGWVLSGMLAAGFYIYAGALLFAEAFLQEDIRPAIFVFAALTGGLALLLHVQIEAVENIMGFLYNYAFILLSAPVLIAALIAPLRLRGRRVRREDQYE